MRFKRLSALGSTLVLSISSLLMIVLPGIAHATGPAFTCTWVGGTNTSFATGANWTGCGGLAPVGSDNDNLVFNTSSLSASQTLTNNIAGLTVTNMTFSGTNSNYYGFTITGNALTILGGITQSSSAYTELNLDVTLGASQTFAISNSSNLYIGDQTLSTSHTLALGSFALTITDAATCSGVSILSALTGSGTLNDNANRLVLNSASPSYTGAVNVNTGTLQVNNSQSLGTGSAGVTVASGAAIAYGISANTTFAEPLTISGTGVSSNGAILADIPSTNAAGCSGGGGGPSTAYTATLSGNITLLGNTTANPTDVDHNIAVTGGLSGNYTLTVVPGASGTLTINSSSNTSLTPNGTQSAPQQTTTISSGDSQPSLAVTVGKNQTYIIDGVRGDTTVNSGGILKGLGTVGNLWVNQGGTVAPGHSPGCLTISGNLNEGGTYTAELDGATACTGYDQLVVSGTVTLDDGNTPPTQGILSVIVDSGFKPTAGQTFTIIKNNGGKAVTDTFSGLSEGSTITVSGYVLKISYVGGAGHDVVLTVISVPKSPNTGFGLTSAGFGLPFLGTSVMAGGIYLISRKFKNPTRVKR